MFFEIDPGIHAAHHRSEIRSRQLWWRLPCLLLAIALLAVAAISARADPAPPPWPTALRHAIQRTVNVEWRLWGAAVHVCPSTAAASGLVLDSLDAYAPRDRPLATRYLGLGNLVQVAAVASGSPAAQTGIVPGDEIVAIAGHDLTAAAKVRLKGPNPPVSLAMAAMEVLAALPAQMPARLDLRRGDRAFTVDLIPQIRCASHIYVSTQDVLTGYSDGFDIILTARLIDFTASDDELALLAGHELAHTITRDGKVSSVALRRRMEERADLVGADLAACAGYDIKAAAAFWKRWSDSTSSSAAKAPRTHGSGAERTARVLNHPAPATCPVTGVPALSAGP